MRKVFASIFKSGKNGFLTVVSSLVGLREATTSEQWVFAVEDVHWVLWEVVKAVELAGCVLNLISPTSCLP